VAPGDEEEAVDVLTDEHYRLDGPPVDPLSSTVFTYGCKQHPGESAYEFSDRMSLVLHLELRRLRGG
jgi:hypothetical protein